MRKLLSLVGIVSVLALLVMLTGPTCEVTYISGVDHSLASAVKNDLKVNESCSVLKINLVSPGGSVVLMQEILNDMERAKSKGQILEVHGSGMIASAATFILAAGSPGHRYIHKRTLALVHSMSSGSECVDWMPELTDMTEDDKVTNQLVIFLVEAYAKYSGKSQAEVYEWIECIPYGNARVGDGEMLVNMGLADHVEE